MISLMDDLTREERAVYKRNTTLYTIGGTKTFRLGSKSMFKRGSFKGIGTNLQNIEKSARQNYEADIGKTMVQVDQSGAEALIVAYLTIKGRFRELFLEGIKPHVYIGLYFPEHWEKQHPAVREIASLPISQIRFHPQWKALETSIKNSDNNPPETRYYYLYKQTCHSGNYDVQAATFILNILEKSRGAVVLSPYDGAKYLDTYNNVAFPEIPLWRRSVKAEVFDTKYLRNLFGDPRYFTGRLDDSTIREAYAFIPQSTVACITHNAYCDLQDYIEEHNLEWDLLGNCHDSYLAQAPDDEAMELANIMIYFMEQQMIAPRGELFRMKAEASKGKNWGPYKEHKNPNGLEEVSFAA